jgi:hypothetical protein
MIMSLSERWSQRLVAMPESGMGYQKVRVRLSNGRELRNVIVQNAERMSLPDDAGQVSEADIQDIELER